MKKIQTGDNVIVISGKWKWAKSTVTSIANDRVIVKGVNTVKKAVRWQWFVEKDAPIHISNIALYDEKAGVASRVSITEQKGKKVRVYKKSWSIVKAA